MQPSVQPKTSPTKLFLANSAFIPEVIKFIEDGHTVTIDLRGYSMRPFLENERDKGLIGKPPRPWKVGDVVLAEVQKGTYVIHRIIKMNGAQVTLRGDGNIGVEHCTVDQLKGFLLGFYRKGRTQLDATNGLKFRVYSKIWIALYPIRRYLLAAYRIWVHYFGPL